MDTQESLREIENLRLRFRMNNRLRLESLAALSKIFREHGEPLRDELLASLVFAVPEELNGGNGRTHGAHETQGGQYASGSDFPPPEVPPGGFPPPTGFPPPEGLPGEVPPDSPESPTNVPPPADFPPPDVPPTTGFPPPDVPPAASAGER